MYTKVSVSFSHIHSCFVSLIKRQSRQHKLVVWVPLCAGIFHFVILAFFACLTAWKSDYEWNQAGCFYFCSLENPTFTTDIHWHPPLIRHYIIFYHVTDLDLITEFYFLPYYTRFPLNMCNGCGMPTEDVYSSGHLVLSHFGTSVCSNVETNLSWTCLVSVLLSFEHPSVLLFCL